MTHQEPAPHAHRTQRVGQYVVSAFFIACTSLVQGAPLNLTFSVSNYHGYNISCFGSHDGAIDLTVTGGTAPYTYQWTNSATTQDITGLAAGYFKVRVTDSQGGTADKDVTLTQPEPLKAMLAVYEYPNTFNVSCYSCYNGSIDATPSGGVTPYTYSWNDGPTTQDRTALGSATYRITVTDNNACQASSDQVYLTEPQRNDWTMSGNTGSNPATQFIGTTDNKDLLFKTNGTERFRLLGNGTITFPGLATTGGAMLRAGVGGHIDVLPLTPTPGPTNLMPFWSTCGNYLNASNMACDPFIGSLDNTALLFKTNGVARARFLGSGLFAVYGKMSIGEPVDVDTDEDYKLYVADGILTEKVKVALRSSSDWEDRVFQTNYALMPLEEVRAYIKANHHLPDVPSADEMVRNGLDVAKTDAMLMRKVEELTLYILELEQRLKELEERTAPPVTR